MALAKLHLTPSYRVVRFDDEYIRPSLAES